MKTIFTSFLLFVLVMLNAQNEFFVHKATSSTIVGYATLIDHPYLNNNPDAFFVVSHAWNPPGGSSVYNNKISGLFYSIENSGWVIYNQDSSNLIVDSSYFIYIPQSGYGAELTASATNIYGNYVILDYPYTNNNPDAVVIVNPIYTTYINNNLGLWYDGNNWKLYNEDGTTGFTIGQKFMIGVAGNNQVAYRHQATVANIESNWTVIDHPLLNNNPNGKFVFTHNWGEDSTSSNVLYDKVAGAWYDGSRWCIYNEDQTNFTQNLMFNLVIDTTTMGVEDIEASQTTIYPNPVVNDVHITSKNTIEEIRIYNMTGEEVLKNNSNATAVQLNVSKLPSGVYVVVIKTSKGVETKKLVKK